MISIPQLVLKKTFAEDPVLIIDELANQSVQQGFFGIQDANLLMAEALRELNSGKEIPSENCILTMVNDWLNLIEKFKYEPKESVLEIINFLRRNELKIAMTDDEFNTLKLQLFNDASLIRIGYEKEIDNVELNAQNINEMEILNEKMGNIERIADQAAELGLYGLQDANLLLIEALREIISDTSVIDAYLLSLLDGWVDLIDRYYKNQKNESESIITFLQNPMLKIQLANEEFTILKEQLVTESCENLLNKVPAERVEYSSFLKVAISEGNNLSNEDFSVVTSEALKLVELLLTESQQVRSYLESIIVGDKETELSGLQQAGDELERFANASKIAGFEGLGYVCLHINVNINRFVEQIDSFSKDRLNLLLDWLTSVQAYLPSYNKNNAGEHVVNGLTNEQWLLPLSSEEIMVILEKIHNESLVFGVEFEALRMEKATDEEVSIALPDDVNQELLELLLQEMPEYTHQFSVAIQRMQSEGNKKDLEVAQRVAHTLKGSANTVGIKGIAVLTHYLEEILVACANEQMVPGRALGNSLINASDCLESMSEALISGNNPPPNAKAVLQEILDWSSRIQKIGLVGSEEEAILTETNTASGKSNYVSEKSRPEPSPEALVRVASDQINNLFRLSGESIILNSQTHQSMRYMKKQLKAMKQQFALLEQLGIELELLIDLKDLTDRPSKSVSSGFDTLEMDQYNELYTASRRVAEAAIDAKEISLDLNKEMDRMNEALDDQQRLIINVQEVVMQTRLVSISTIAPRLHRSVRQTCRMTGKESKLVLIGEKIMIDGGTLNAIVDPILHLLRNAVDHGIEIGEERLAKGKPSCGEITLGFERYGNSILVRCRDDGRGLDYLGIRLAAEKRGILQPGAPVNNEELRSLILRPNFSSRSFSTQTSGRGVGMDVVYNQITEMGGKLVLDSDSDRGMTIEFTVPLPLSLTYALLTNIGHYRLAIASKGIIQIIYASVGDLKVVDGKEVMLLDENTYPVARLADLLNISDHRKASLPYASVLLVQNEGKIMAVLTDSITDSLDVVIKSMGYYIEKIPGYIGATILGDGTVTPVIDIPELLSSPARNIARANSEQPIANSFRPVLPTVLVVDDSLSQRRALEQLLKDAGYNVRTARDGIDAAELMAGFKPDIVLTDFEMPRMNGIELASHIRKQDKIKSVPVIMVTSRATLKHRQMAEKAGVDFYFTKPVRDEALLLKMRELMEVFLEKTREIA